MRHVKVTLLIGAFLLISIVGYAQQSQQLQQIDYSKMNHAEMTLYRTNGPDTSIHMQAVPVNPADKVNTTSTTSHSTGSKAPKQSVGSAKPVNKTAHEANPPK